MLGIARSALEESFGGQESPRAEADWLANAGACFVTLKQEGKLRGCIGSVEPCRPLADDLRENALAAAFRDHRFSPLTAQELEHTIIEVSVLSPLERMECSSEEDLLNQLRPGIDGLVIDYQSHRATFLPAVWGGLPRCEDFLGQLKRKAGLEPDFWSPELKAWRFSAATFPCAKRRKWLN